MKNGLRNAKSRRYGRTSNVEKPFGESLIATRHSGHCQRAPRQRFKAQSTKHDLIDSFGAGHDRVSTHDGMQYMKLWTVVLASLSRARQKSMKQTELHAYLES
jgi:hypothetical protein